MKKKYVIFTVIIPLILICGLLIAYYFNTRTLSGITSIKVEVSGQAINAEQYRKLLLLTKDSSGFALNFERTSVDELKYGKDVSISKEVDNLSVTRFVKSINKLQDEGDSALCCDHPFTIITMTMSSGEQIIKKVALEPIIIEDYFNIEK